MCNQKLSNLKRFALAAVAVLTMSVAAFAQNVAISGKVVDNNNEPIVGAYVVVEGTTLGTSTDIDGQYKITAPANSTLTFTCIGYKTQSVQVGGRNVIDIILADDAEMLQ